MPPPVCRILCIGRAFTCRRACPVRNSQEFLLYQRGAPLQFLRLRVCHKRGGPNVVVLHRRLLRRIATPAAANTANTATAEPSRPAECLLTPLREYLLRHSWLRLLHLIRL